MTNGLSKRIISVLMATALLLTMFSFTALADDQDSTAATGSFKIKTSINNATYNVYQIFYGKTSKNSETGLGEIEYAYYGKNAHITETYTKEEWEIWGKGNHQEWKENIIKDPDSMVGSDVLKEFKILAEGSYDDTQKIAKLKEYVTFSDPIYYGTGTGSDLTIGPLKTGYYAIEISQNGSKSYRFAVLLSDTDAGDNGNVIDTKEQKVTMQMMLRDTSDYTKGDFGDDENLAYATYLNKVPVIADTETGVVTDKVIANPTFDTGKRGQVQATMRINLPDDMTSISEQNITASFSGFVNGTSSSGNDVNKFDFIKSGSNIDTGSVTVRAVKKSVVTDAEANKNNTTAEDILAEEVKNATSITNSNLTLNSSPIAGQYIPGSKTYYYHNQLQVNLGKVREIALEDVLDDGDKISYILIDVTLQDDGIGVWNSEVIAGWIEEFAPGATGVNDGDEIIAQMVRVKTYSLIVDKTDDNNKPLSGAEFQLMDEDGNYAIVNTKSVEEQVTYDQYCQYNVIVGWTKNATYAPTSDADATYSTKLKTDENGWICFAGLDSLRNYKLIETDYPQYYINDNGDAMPYYSTMNAIPDDAKSTYKTWDEFTGSLKKYVALDDMTICVNFYNDANKIEQVEGQSEEDYTKIKQDADLAIKHRISDYGSWESFSAIGNEMYYSAYLTNTNSQGDVTAKASSKVLGTGDKGYCSFTLPIINYIGTPLPETGGMGTILFYIIGGILVAGAAILLIAKKRMNAE